MPLLHSTLAAIAKKERARIYSPLLLLCESPHYRLIYWPILCALCGDIKAPMPGRWMKLSAYQGPRVSINSPRRSGYRILISAFGKKWSTHGQ
jgi:hypothetical protein